MLTTTRHDGATTLHVSTHDDGDEMRVEILSALERGDAVTVMRRDHDGSTSAIMSAKQIGRAFVLRRGHAVSKHGVAREVVGEMARALPRLIDWRS